MKTLFIEAKSDISLDIPEVELKKLPKKIGITTTIQHLHKIKEVQGKIPGSVLAGQILGCDAGVAVNIKEDVDAFLYIGSGVFHPIEITIETGKDVFCWNPFTKEMKLVGQEERVKHEGRKQASLIKFLSADRVGILVSTKPGQNKMVLAKKLAERKDKEYHIFAFDTLNEMDLENFNFIQCWVNTACPRIADEKSNIINIKDIPEES